MSAALNLSPVGLASLSQSPAGSRLTEHSRTESIELERSSSFLNSRPLAPFGTELAWKRPCWKLEEANAMSRKSELTVWAAVTAGLDYCQQSSAPHVVLGEFLEKLRERGWEDSDTQVVEQCVAELLNWDSGQAPAGGNGRLNCSPASQSDVCGRPVDLCGATGDRVRWRKPRLEKRSWTSFSRPATTGPNVGRIS